MKNAHHVKTYLILVTMLLSIGCEDPTQPTGADEGCDGLVTPCPEGTSCQLDAIGNPFCSSEPPLIPPAGSEAPISGVSGGERSGGTMDTGGMSAGLSAGIQGGGSVEGGASVMGGGERVGGASAGVGEVSDCQGFQTSLKPSRGSAAEVMLVVDRSYSMVNSEDRWTPALEAISQVTQRLEEGVSFGLTLFPDPIETGGDLSELNQCTSWGRDPYSCEEDIAACAPGRVMLEPALNNAMSVQALLTTHRPLPDLGTPTYSALQVAGEQLMASTRGGAKVILLITDGMPGCNFAIEPTTCTCLTSAPIFCELDSFAGMCLNDQQTTAEVTRLAGLGVQTVVVGLTIGLPEEGACIEGVGCPFGGQGCVNGRCVNLAPSVLTEMARAGGSPTGSYYSVGDVSELSEQIAQAAGGFAPCVFDVSTIPESSYRALTVYVDGESVPPDEGRMNGWWAEAGQLELYGEACASIRDGQSHQVSARCE